MDSEINSDNTLRLLVVEDDDLDFQILTRHLETLRDPRYEMVRAVNAREALAAISQYRFDAGLVDHRLSDGLSGLDFIERLGGREADFPLIVLTGMDARDFDQKAILSGAYDYLDKMGLSRDLIDRSIRFSIQSHKYDRQMRQAIAEAKEQASINRNILSIVSHEMKSPISSLIGYCEYLAESAKEDTIRDAAHKMKAASIHLEDFLRNLSEYVRLDSGSAEISKINFHLKEMLDETVSFFQPYAQHKGISFKTEIDASTDHVFTGDRLRIRQVMINLLKNAVTYTDNGSVSISATVEDGVLKVTIADEGVGMSEEKVEAVLADIIRKQAPGKDLEGGLGLGLSICRRLLRLMSGQLSLESTPGFGTTVRFDTPLKRTGGAAEAA